MRVRDLIQRLLDHALDGQGGHEQVLVRCDGQLLTIESVETRVSETGQDTPDLFILVVADGPSTTVEASAYSPYT